jgi:hypothetical protein
VRATVKRERGDPGCYRQVAGAYGDMESFGTHRVLDVLLYILWSVALHKVEPPACIADVLWQRSSQQVERLKRVDPDVEICFEEGGR